MRANSCHYCPAWITGLVFTLGILTLIFVGACRQNVQVVDRPQPHKTKDVITTPAAPPTRASRPHGPAYRVDNGLGSPIA